MKIIKGVLEEELENSMRIREQYKKALESLPKGNLIEKEIRGHKYYYLEQREGSKVRFVYKGKKEKVSEKEVKKYTEAKKLRAQYRKLLSQANKQVSFLRKVLEKMPAVLTSPVLLVAKKDEKQS